MKNVGLYGGEGGLHVGLLINCSQPELKNS